MKHLGNVIVLMAISTSLFAGSAPPKKEVIVQEVIVKETFNYDVSVFQTEAQVVSFSIQFLDSLSKRSPSLGIRLFKKYFPQNSVDYIKLSSSFINVRGDLLKKYGRSEGFYSLKQEHVDDSLLKVSAIEIIGSRTFNWELFYYKPSSKWLFHSLKLFHNHEELLR